MKKNQSTRTTENGQNHKLFYAKDNRGTIFDNADIADAYWSNPYSLSKKDPFIFYTFETEHSAREAILELPCIHAASDQNTLICTETLNFGYYQNDEGNYDAIMSGTDLTQKLWRQAKASFIKYGGRPIGKGERIPKKRRTHIKNINVSQSNEIVFVEETRQPHLGYTYVYRVHEGSNSTSAKKFLKQLPVPAPLHYIVVKTPEGNYCLDNQGMYRE